MANEISDFSKFSCINTTNDTILILIDEIKQTIDIVSNEKIDNLLLYSFLKDYWLNDDKFKNILFPVYCDQIEISLMYGWTWKNGANVKILNHTCGHCPFNK